jgi:hypothetical protein
MSEGSENVPELPFDPGGDAWVYVEAADPLHLELARRGAEHVLGVVADWVGWEYGQLAWEYGWVIQVEERDSEWEVIVQGLTDGDRVLNLLVPEARSTTLDLRLAVDLVAQGGSVLLVYDPAKRRNSAGEGCSWSPQVNSTDCCPSGGRPWRRCLQSRPGHEGHRSS